MADPDLHLTGGGGGGGGMNFEFCEDYSGSAKKMPHFRKNKVGGGGGGGWLPWVVQFTHIFLERCLILFVFKYQQYYPPPLPLSWRILYNVSEFVIRLELISTDNSLSFIVLGLEGKGT